MTHYIVSDYSTDTRGAGYWRTMAVMNSIVLARNFAGPQSIITAHSRDEANEIHITRRLPAEYEVVA